MREKGTSPNTREWNIVNAFYGQLMCHNLVNIPSNSLAKEAVRTFFVR